jgi:hypothetical protein
MSLVKTAHRNKHSVAWHFVVTAADDDDYIEPIQIHKERNNQCTAA